uniref:Carn_acyltransf domain-containing protein n=1 Tax=Rhabditophanes sp. KR3021 TaxID=114890 RepID=A0AC35TZA6_9BILA
MTSRHILAGARSFKFIQTSPLSFASTMANKIFGTPQLPKIGTNGLPKLTVPDLANTISTFVLFAKPIQNDKEFEKTTQLAKDFVKSPVATKLQNYLKEREDKLNNWLTPWWLNVAYLEGRDPLTIVTSPGIIFPNQPFNGVNDQCLYAAKYIQAALAYHHRILDNMIPQDKAGNTLFEMEQYKYLFGTTRIPRPNKDELVYGKSYGEWPEHIVILRKGHVFKVPVYDEYGHILGLDQLTTMIKRDVINQSEMTNECPVLAVSSSDRETWAKVWSKLESNNPDYIATIKSALFTVNLDESYTDNIKPTEHALSKVAHQALTGGGSQSNSINRWYDKTLQILISVDGKAAISYEHTPLDGPPVGAMCDFICDFMEEGVFKGSTNSLKVHTATRLQFDIDNDIKAAVKKSLAESDRVSNNLDVKVHTFTKFGKNLPKQMKMSPDSFIQLAFQLAFYRLHGRHPPTYETASIRKFDEGRTETIRLPNIDTANFVETFADGKVDKEKLGELLRKAVESHKNYSVAAMNGRGVDRHLLGLRLAARELGIETPQLFKEDAYQKMMHFNVSTSQVPTKHDMAMGFGPSAPDCYGICYNPKETEIVFTITTFNNCPDTSTIKFAAELDQAFEDMRNILMSTASSTTRSKL